MKKTMKKASIFLILGTALSLWGLMGILDGNSPLSPLVAFLGFSTAFFPWGVPAQLNARDFDISAKDNAVPSQESLLLARYFIALSVIVRREGILALLDKNFDETYQNGLYRLGKDMLVDGIAPDLIRQEFSSVSYTLRQRYREQVGRIMQTGKYLATITVFGFMGCGSMFLLRGNAVVDICFDIWIILTVIGAICAISVLCLLPGQMRHILFRRNLIHRQMQVGFDMLRQCASPLDMARSQIPYLSEDEQEQFFQRPLPEEARGTLPSDSFDDVTENLRQSMGEMCHYTL